MSRREWLLIIALIMMGEYWLISLSYRFSGWQEVVNFISFSAAIASILLAVIAIIYGFLQADSSSKASSILQGQAQSLSSYTSKLSDSASEINSWLEELSGITRRLDKIDFNVESSVGLAQKVNENFSALDQFIKEKRNVEISELSADVGADGRVLVEDVLRVVFTRSSYSFDLLGYAIYKYISSGSTVSVREFYDVYLKGLSSRKAGSVVSAYYSIISLLNFLDVIESEDLDDDFLVNERWFVFFDSIIG